MLFSSRIETQKRVGAAECRISENSLFLHVSLLTVCRLVGSLYNIYLAETHVDAWRDNTSLVLNHPPPADCFLLFQKGLLASFSFLADPPNSFERVAVLSSVFFFASSCSSVILSCRLSS